MNGKIEEIPYKDIVIVCKKDRKNLKPNISVTRDFLNIPETIRGNIIIACKANKEFKSISKSQAIEYMNFLQDSSFHYDNTDLNMFKDRNVPLKSIKQDSRNSNDETLKMILAMQTVILKFIKNYEN